MNEEPISDDYFIPDFPENPMKQWWISSQDSILEAKSLNLPKVYVASKIDMAETWKAFSLNWFSQLRVISSWINMVGTVPDTKDYAEEFWGIDIQEVQECDYLILCGEEGKHLRGGLVEAGAALARGKPVIIIGDHPDYGTWQHHICVIKVATLDDAAAYIVDSWDSF